MDDGSDQHDSPSLRGEPEARLRRHTALRGRRGGRARPGGHRPHLAVPCRVSGLAGLPCPLPGAVQHGRAGPGPRSRRPRHRARLPSRLPRLSPQTSCRCRDAARRIPPRPRPRGRSEPSARDRAHGGRLRCPDRRGCRPSACSRRDLLHGVGELSGCLAERPVHLEPRGPVTGRRPDHRPVPDHAEAVRPGPHEDRLCRHAHPRRRRGRRPDLQPTAPTAHSERQPRTRRHPGPALPGRAQLDCHARPG
jgi:hypothetical protein